ncbi:hypothetical protein D3C79_662450 [compost metagenome]
MLDQQVEGVGQFSADLCTPALAVLRIAGARLEGRVFGGCGQQQVHLAQALAKQGRKAAEFGQGVSVRFGVVAGGLHLVADGPFQRVLGPTPGIALVAQVTLGNHQQVRRVLFVHPADPGQQRRDVGKAGGGQVGTHFQLWMDARVDPADQLEHHAVANDHRTVGLLGAEVAHFALLVERQAGQLLCAFEAQFTLSVATRQTQAILAGLHHGVNERLEDEGVCDQANLVGTAHPRQRQLLRQRGMDLLLTQQAERQLVAGGRAVAEYLDFAEQHRRGGGAETHAVTQAHGINRPFLAGEPAALGQVLRQDGALQRIACGGLQQFFHALAQYQCGQFG